jgi:hypothetical protein
MIPFPEGCPPEDAEAMSGDFYRLATRSLQEGDPTDDASWLRPYETRGSPFYKMPETPEAHGVSIFAGLDDLHSCLAMVPQLRKKSVARVTIDETQGVLRPSPIEHGATHHDWWTEPYTLIPEAEVIEAGGE